MTDQKYKLVPVKPTEEMLFAVRQRLPTFALNIEDVRRALRAAIAAVPESVCKWTYLAGHGCRPGCIDAGEGVDPIRIPHPDDRFCPHCGSRIQVVGDE